MEKQKIGPSQEGLKGIACVTMLMDHIGATLVYDMYWAAAGAGQNEKAQTLYYIYFALRIIGRIAFPIYCFLLAEGAYHTRNPKKYALRLLIGMVLAEIPFDMALFGELTWEHQSVMVTLLLGYGAIYLSQRAKGYWKILIYIPFAILAQWLNTDYGAMGVAMIALFALTREVDHKRFFQVVGMVILCMTSGGIELFAVLAMIPISVYHGRKLTHSKPVLWLFYLFYPVHLLVLWLVSLT